MRPGTYGKCPVTILLHRNDGSTLRTLPVIAGGLLALTLCLIFGIPPRYPGLLKSDSKKASSESSAQVSGMADRVSHRWAAARVEVLRELKGTSLSDSPKEAVEHFISTMPQWHQTFAEVETLTESTLQKLDEKQREFADPHYQSLLPSEVLPELAQAIRKHIHSVKRVQSEVHTLRSQTLPDIETRLRKLAEAAQIKAQLSGREAAQKLWQSGVNEIATPIGGVE